MNPIANIKQQPIGTCTKCGRHTFAVQGRFCRHCGHIVIKEI